MSTASVIPADSTQWSPLTSLTRCSSLTSDRKVCPSPQMPATVFSNEDSPGGLPLQASLTFFGTEVSVRGFTWAPNVSVPLLCRVDNQPCTLVLPTDNLEIVHVTHLAANVQHVLKFGALNATKDFSSVFLLYVFSATVTGPQPRIESSTSTIISSTSVTSSSTSGSTTETSSTSVFSTSSDVSTSSSDASTSETSLSLSLTSTVSSFPSQSTVSTPVAPQTPISPPLATNTDEALAGSSGNSRVALIVGITVPVIVVMSVLVIVAIVLVRRSKSRQNIRPYNARIGSDPTPAIPATTRTGKGFPMMEKPSRWSPNVAPSTSASRGDGTSTSPSTSGGDDQIDVPVLRAAVQRAGISLPALVNSLNRVHPDPTELDPPLYDGSTTSNRTSVRGRGMR